MKRIAITIAALTFSVSGIAVADEDYGSVLNDRVSKTSSYNNPETYAENHGSVLLDLVPGNQIQSQPRSYDRGLSTEISIGDADSIFNAGEDDTF